RGMKIVERKAAARGSYTSLITVRMHGHELSGTVLMEEPRVVRIDSFRVDLMPEGRFLVSRHADRPGIVGRVGTILGEPDADIARYLDRSPHNVIRLTRPGHDYDGAARTLEAWLQAGTLRADDPSMYVHEVDLGDGRTRRDLLAALRLEPYERRVVLPHE